MKDRFLSIVLLLGAALMASNPDHEVSTWRNLLIAGLLCYQAGYIWRRNDSEPV
jgi:hypothetical protein